MAFRRLSVLVAVLLALALFAAACGSDSDSGDSSSEADSAEAEDTAAEEATEDDGADEADDEEVEPADEAAADEATADEGDEEAAEDPPPVDTEGEGSDPSLCPVDALDAADGPVDVEFWHAMNTVNKDTLEAMVADYNASQDKVNVNVIAQGSYEETLQKYIGAAGGGDLPDITQMEETVMQIMVDSQTIVPIGSCIAADSYDTSDFVPPLFGQYSLDGELKTMPFQLSNPVLYYNLQRFEAAGLDPNDPPQTFDEVLEVSRQLVESGSVPKAMSLEIQGWYPEQWSSIAGEALVDNENGRVDRPREALLDNPAITESFELINTLNQEGLLLNVGPNPTGADHLLALAQDQAAFTIGTSAALGTIYDAIDEFPNVTIGVAPMPSPAEPVGGVTVGGGSLYMMKDSDDEVKAAVWDLMKWLSEPEQQARWAMSTGYIPTRISAIEDPELQALWTERPGFRVAFDQLADSVPPPGGGGPVIGDYVSYRNAIEKAIERIINGTPVAEAQADAQAEGTEAITDYNDRVGA
jgi:sn-glycerol 3-phosphate transport system substrate-binding protein